jgi:Mn-dependent DtxR family transcriptional regulator
MTRDRLSGDAIPYTQEALAGRLGVQRQAVALAAEALKHVGAIDYRRGTVVVTDGGALEAAACED